MTEIPEIKTEHVRVNPELDPNKVTITFTKDELQVLVNALSTSAQPGDKIEQIILHSLYLKMRNRLEQST